MDNKLTTSTTAFFDMNDKQQVTVLRGICGSIQAMDYPKISNVQKVLSEFGMELVPFGYTTEVADSQTEAIIALNNGEVSMSKLKELKTQMGLILVSNNTSERKLEHIATLLSTSK